MDIIAQPLILISIIIGTMNIIERILRKSTKYNKLLEKIGKSKERLIELSHKQLSINDTVDDDTLLGEMLDFIENIENIGFHIPN